MKEIQRISPVEFKITPLKTEKRNNWEVVMEYSGEGEGPYLVDLSHKPRFDLQDADLAARKPFGIGILQTFGSSVLENGILANRMNRTQVSLYCLDGQDNAGLPDEPGFTDVTESTILIALIGKEVFSICEKLTALDFMDPERKTPFLYQGPFSHVPCQIVTLSRDKERSGILLTCSRGYGRDMIHAVLQAGEEFSLKPAGENCFTNWIKNL
jgi:hypothetical protein